MKMRGEVLEGSGQIPCEVLEGSGAETLQGSGGFWRRYLVRFRKFPEKMPGEVLEFWRVAVQIPCELPEVPVQHAKVPEGTGVWYWKKC